MFATMNIPTSIKQGGNPHQNCIDLCVKCAQICQECLTMCLQEEDVKSRINCIKTLQDCSEICSTAACFMSRESSNAIEICNACADICNTCATECGMFEDQHCKSCADVCKQCASECRNMSNM